MELVDLCSSSESDSGEDQAGGAATSAAASSAGAGKSWVVKDAGTSPKGILEALTRGRDVPTAFHELVDNSLRAKAKRLRIVFDTAHQLCPANDLCAYVPENLASVTGLISFWDDGGGMSKSELEAFAAGSVFQMTFCTHLHLRNQCVRFVRTVR